MHLLCPSSKSTSVSYVAKQLTIHLSQGIRRKPSPRFIARRLPIALPSASQNCYNHCNCANAHRHSHKNQFKGISNKMQIYGFHFTNINNKFKIYHFLCAVQFRSPHSSRPGCECSCDWYVCMTLLRLVSSQPFFVYAHNFFYRRFPACIHIGGCATTIYHSKLLYYIIIFIFVSSADHPILATLSSLSLYLALAAALQASLYVMPPIINIWKKAVCEVAKRFCLITADADFFCFSSSLALSCPFATHPSVAFNTYTIICIFILNIFRCCCWMCVIWSGCLCTRVSPSGTASLFG